MKRKFIGITAGAIMAVGFGANFVLGNVQAFENKPEVVYAAEEENEVYAAEETKGAILASETPIDDSQKAPRNIVTNLANGFGGHSFVNHYNYVYSKVDTTNYADQKITAEQILEIIKDRQISDKDLAADFDKMEVYAKDIVKENDRGSMKQLERLLHDLDMYMHGYQDEKAWGVTDYKGE